MSIIEKLFHYGKNEISVIRNGEDIWFRAKQVADSLGYSDPGRAIRQIVDHEDRMSLDELKGEGESPSPLFHNCQGTTQFINESGLYSLRFGSKLDSAKVFKRWVTKDVLPMIRKTGNYYSEIIHNYNRSLTFRIESENDLHVKDVSFIKKRYPHSIFIATLGENQDTRWKRMDCFMKGYLKGSPDLIINNLHKHHSGLAIEFKSPKGFGMLSLHQSIILEQYRRNGFKTLVSNDYDLIVEEIIEYFRYVRILCSYCPRKFINRETLINLCKFFHRK